MMKDFLFLFGWSIASCTCFLLLQFSNRTGGEEVSRRPFIDFSRLNREELKVPPFSLPNPLIFQDGTPVKNKEDWFERRRPELLRLFSENVYGQTPTDFKGRIRYKTISEAVVFEGKGLRREIAIYFTDRPDTLVLHLLIFTPNRLEGPVPTFLGLNFKGNHTVSRDPGIHLPMVWNSEWDVTTPVLAAEENRGSSESRWPVEFILEQGFALATAYYKEIDVDVNDNFERGIHTLFKINGQKNRTDEEWGKIGSWAWGLSRCMDYLEGDSRINSKQVVLIGHSRLGKTALWAGAQDERFAIVISNDSGCGGAAPGRRFFGEYPKFLSDIRPHWFCKKYNKLAENVEQIPVDQNELIALMAPRPVYVASATLDDGADPKGEFLSVLNADSVYRFLGLPGLGDTTEWPKPDISIGQTLGYHVRTGKHDITLFDWQQYLFFAKRYFKVDFDR